LYKRKVNETTKSRDALLYWYVYAISSFFLAVYLFLSPALAANNIINVPDKEGSHVAPARLGVKIAERFFLICCGCPLPSFPAHYYPFGRAIPLAARR
jgi:hypothetical protein